MIYDVVIIGAGVVGAFIARVLSQYKLSVCLAEKESDAAMGSSKANSGIVHAGYDAEPGSLKARFNVAGSSMMEKTCGELDVPFKRTGSLVLAFQGDNADMLGKLYDRGINNGVKGMELLDGQRLRAMEPNVSELAEAALYAPSGAIVCPYELTLGAVENAVENGVELRLDCKVNGIRYENELFIISTSSGSAELRSRYVVNAAGMFADKISAMIGDYSFDLHPRKGEYILFDKNKGGAVSNVIFQLPGEKGKGVLVTRTVDGNLLIGPNAQDIDDRCDVATSAAGLEQVLKGARRSVPSLDMKDIVTSFAGLRAKASGGDFIIRPSSQNNKFIQAAGIDSPGITAAPAIGGYVAELLESQGLVLVKKPGYNPERRRIIRFRSLSDEEADALIKKEPAYGRVVCRCETVTEGEVIDCIRRPAGARSLDAVKRRTRSGMGRCQGGFCSPRIMEILSRELNIPFEEVTKQGGSSKILAGKLK